MRKLHIIVSSLIGGVLIILGIFAFRNSWLRAAEAVVDFGRSVAYYFCELFFIDHNIPPSVIEKSDIFVLDFNFADNSSQFFSDAKAYFSLLFSGGNFQAYLAGIEDGMLTFVRVITIAVPTLIVLIMVVRMVYRRPNVKHGKDTVPLRLFRRAMQYTYLPVKRWLRSYREFLVAHGWIWKLSLFVAFMHLNLVSIVIAFLAFYFYFAVSFDFAALFVQCVINLGMNLQVLPVIGVTLPFFSAGGSSVVMVYLCVGLVLSVGRQARTHRLQAGPVL